jgi:hypothetical protein
MGKFFEHLQENLLAIQNEENSEIGQPERRRMSSDSSLMYRQKSQPSVDNYNGNENNALGSNLDLDPESTYSGANSQILYI